jgi:TM2 domain-containing membrane protein YozV
MDLDDQLGCSGDKTYRSPMKATLLSLLFPGLGQLYLGRRSEGLIGLITGGGIIFAVLLSTVGPVALRSWVSALFLELAYISVWLTSVLEASQREEKSRQSLLGGEKAWYIVVMLAMAGPIAFPMLWHSSLFSRWLKIALTVTVILILAIGVLLVMLLGSQLESWSSEILPLLWQGTGRR